MNHFQNILCHIAGLNHDTKVRLISFLERNEFPYNIIDLDELTTNINSDQEIKELQDKRDELMGLSKQGKFQKEYVKKAKQVEKNMNTFWKKKLEVIMNKDCAKDKINIVIGLCNRVNNSKVFLNINTKIKCFVDINDTKNAQNIIAKNLDNFRDDIISGDFPLQYLDINFIIKKRQTLLKIYEKKGYIHKDIDHIMDILLMNIEYNKEFSSIGSIYMASDILLDGYIEPSDCNIGYVLPWLAIVSMDKFEHIKKGYNRKGSGYIKETKKAAFKILDSECYLYELKKENFFYFRKNQKLKLLTTSKNKILKKYTIHNISHYLDNNKIKQIQINHESDK